jgi:hypothetical protein
MSSAFTTHAYAAVDWMGLLNSYETTSKQNRIIIAKGLLTDVYELIDASIPNLKPGEREWVEKEKKDLRILEKSGQLGGDAWRQKYSNMWNAKEYHIYALKERLKNILFPLRVITKNNKNMSLREEMALWAEVVYWITNDTNDIDNSFLFLKKAKIIDPKSIAGLTVYDDGNDYWLHQTTYANNVQGAIVLAYLRGDIIK